MCYSRIFILSLGLTLTACVAVPIAPTEAPPPIVATVAQPTHPPPTLAATMAVSPEAPTPGASPELPTAASTIEPPTAEPTTEPPTAEPTTEPPTAEPTSAPTPVLLSGAFVAGEVPVSGSYTVDVANNTLTLSNDFQVVPGPDLVVILSGVGDVSLDFHTFSAQVLQAPLLRLGPLANSAGAQTYIIPDGTGLAVYQSVVIWCDSFSVEFAAALLKP